MLGASIFGVGASWMDGENLGRGNPGMAHGGGIGGVERAMGTGARPGGIERPREESGGGVRRGHEGARPWGMVDAPLRCLIGSRDMYM